MAAGLLAVVAAGQTPGNQGAVRGGESDNKVAPARMADLDLRYQKQIDAKQWEEALKTIDQMGLCAACTSLWHLRVYSAAGDVANYASTARTILQGKFKDDPDVLNEIAWYIVSPQGTLRPRNLDLAREAAEKAVSLSKGRDAGDLDTLAWTCHWLGQNERATKLEREALNRAIPSEKDIYRRILRLNFN